MKVLLSCLVVSIGLASGGLARAQEAERTEAPARSPGLAIGFSLETIQDDFGLDLDFTTPYFFNETMAVRIRGGIAWANGIPEGEAEEDWLLYTPARVALVGSWTFAADRVRLYSEAGSILIFSIQDVSSNAFTGIGGYGLFGFEFFSGDNVPMTYFIEGGGMGTSASADELTTKPSLANGFFTAVGIRFYP